MSTKNVASKPKWSDVVPKKTQNALKAAQLHTIQDIFLYEQDMPLTDISGIDTPQKALEIYGGLRLAGYRESDFWHYQETLQQQQSQYDPYAELLKDLYGHRIWEHGEIQYIVPSLARPLIDKVVNSIPERKAKAIRLYYGLDSGYKLIYRALGSLLDPPEDAIRAQHILTDGLRELRKPSLRKYIEFLTWDRDRLLEKIIKIYTDAEKYHTGYPLPVDNLLEISIDTLNLSARIYRPLRRAGVNTIGDIFKRKRSGLERITNIGTKRVEEIIEKLREILPANDPIWSDFE